jgi:hypothetical protein
MANHVDTYITIHNIDENIKSELTRMFEYDSSFGQLGGVELINRVYKTTFTWNPSLTHEENTTEGNTLPDLEWMHENVGSKWIFVETFDIDDDTSTLSLSTAWSFPEPFVQKLTDILTQIKSDVYLSGLYEDEGLDPVGGFVFGHDYDDIEDFDHEYESDEVWEDDDVREKFYDELNALRDELVESYLDFIEDTE